MFEVFTWQAPFAELTTSTDIVAALRRGDRPVSVVLDRHTSSLIVASASSGHRFTDSAALSRQTTVGADRTHTLANIATKGRIAVTTSMCLLFLNHTSTL